MSRTTRKNRRGDKKAQFHKELWRTAYNKEDAEKRRELNRRHRYAVARALRSGAWDSIVEPRKTQGWYTW